MKKTAFIMLPIIIMIFFVGCVSPHDTIFHSSIDNFQQHNIENNIIGAGENQSQDKAEEDTQNNNNKTSSNDNNTASTSPISNGKKSEDSPNELLKKNIKDKVDTFVNSKKFKGSILVAYKGDLLFKGAFGKANIEKNIENTVNTKFMIASMTKQFAAMSILILQEKGLLSVNDTVNKYIPELPNGDKITIHHLLNHTSGLPVILPNSRGDSYLKNYPGSTNEQKILYGIKKRHIYTAFTQESFHYSDINYMIVGHIVEKVSGISFEDFLSENIFIPLDMNDSGVGYYPDIDKLPIGYGSQGNKLQAGLSCSDMGYGAGSMFSTVEDLYKWDRALYTEKLVTTKSLESMFTRYNNIYGYGWWFWETSKGFIPVHGGRLLNGSFSGFFVRNTIDDICVIILGNDGNHDDKRDFAIEVCLELCEENRQ